LLIHEQLEILLALASAMAACCSASSSRLASNVNPLLIRALHRSTHQGHGHQLQGLQAFIVVNDLAHFLLQELIQIGFLDDGPVDARIRSLAVGADGDEIPVLLVEE
jgi:hypothetical protein